MIQLWNYDKIDNWPIVQDGFDYFLYLYLYKNRKSKNMKIIYEHKNRIYFVYNKWSNLKTNFNS